MSQGSALAAPCGSRCLTFALGAQEKKKFITYIVQITCAYDQVRIAYKSILLTKNYKKLNVHDQKFTKCPLDLIKS